MTFMVTMCDHRGNDVGLRAICVTFMVTMCDPRGNDVGLRALCVTFMVTMRDPRGNDVGLKSHMRDLCVDDVGLKRPLSLASSDVTS